MVFPRSKKIIFEGQKAPDKHVSWSESRSKVMPSTNPWTERLRLCGWTWFGVSPQRETAVSSAHRNTYSSVASEGSSAVAPHTRLWCPSTWSSAGCRSVCAGVTRVCPCELTPHQHVKCCVVMHEHVCSCVPSRHRDGRQLWVRLGEILRPLRVRGHLELWYHTHGRRAPRLGQVPAPGLYSSPSPSSALHEMTSRPRLTDAFEVIWLKS